MNGCLSGNKQMYTVFRVLGSDLQALNAVGQAMNEKRPGIFSGIRPRGDGFACDVCRDDEWTDHTDAIKHFLVEFRDIVLGLPDGLHGAFDTAVGPEDVSGYVYRTLTVDPATIGASGPLYHAISRRR
jgi:hypothetical protein